MKPRKSLLLGVLAAGLAATGMGFFIVHNFAPEAAMTRVFVDLGLLALLAGVVVAFTRTPAQRVDELQEALRELTRGVRSRRLNPKLFGDLEPIARAYNDVAAFMSEHDDPNLGPVRTAPRYSAPTPDATARADAEHSYHPELGPVRVVDPPVGAEADASSKNGRSSSHEAKAQPADPPAPAAPEAPSAPRKRRSKKNRRGPAESAVPDAALSQAPRERPPADQVPASTEAMATSLPIAQHEPEERPAYLAIEDEAVEPSPTNDTTIDELPPEEDAPEAEDAPGPVANGAPETAKPSASVEAALSGEAEIRHLFDSFVAAKRRHEELTDDLDYEAFADTVREEREHLRSMHQCKDVRFEVTIEDGEVSLLPRLLR